MPHAVLAAGLFHEYPRHRFGGRGKEMAATVPLRRLAGPDQPQIGFVNSAVPSSVWPGFSCATEPPQVCAARHTLAAEATRHR